MSKTELKLIATRVTELYEDGVIAISPRFRREANVPSVHLTEEKFKEMFPTMFFVEVEDDYDRVSFMDDGIEFFALVDRDE